MAVGVITSYVGGGGGFSETVRRGGKCKSGKILALKIGGGVAQKGRR